MSQVHYPFRESRGTRFRQRAPEAPAAFQRLQKLTKALLGVSREEYDQKRTEYDRQANERREQWG
jgi:hypothetical protein